MLRLVSERPDNLQKYFYISHFTFIHLADAFIPMRTIEAVQLTVGQQYASALGLLSRFFFFKKHNVCKINKMECFLNIGITNTNNQKCL